METLNYKASRRKHRNLSSEPWAAQRNSEAPRRYMERWAWPDAIKIKSCSSKTAAHAERRAARPVRAPGGCEQHPGPSRARLCVWTETGPHRGSPRPRAGETRSARVLPANEPRRGARGPHAARRPLTRGSPEDEAAAGQGRAHAGQPRPCWGDGLFLVLAT